MACPFFLPGALLDGPRPARAPLGEMYSGQCTAAGVDPPRDLLVEACNFGYAKNRCPFWPAAGGKGDALRFSMRKSESPTREIVWVLEREHIPVEFGTLVYSRERGLEPMPGDPILARQAVLFAERYADA